MPTKAAEPSLVDLQREESIRKILAAAAMFGAGGAGLRGLRGMAGVRRRGKDDKAPRPYASVDIASLGAQKHANEDSFLGSVAGKINNAINSAGLTGKGLFHPLPKSRGDIMGSPGLLAAALGTPLAAVGGYKLTDKVLDARRRAELEAERESARADFEAAIRGDTKAASLARLSRARVADKAANDAPGGGGTADTVVSAYRALPLMAILAGAAGGGLLGHRHGAKARKKDQAAEEAARRRMRAYVQQTPVLLTGDYPGPAGNPSV